MKKREKGFAVIVSLLFVAITSAVAATAFFISVSDLKILFNRLQDAKSLRETERILAEAEMEMELCMAEDGVADCVSEVETSVAGVTGAETLPDGFLLRAEGKAGNFSTVVEAVYSAQNGAVKIRNWRHADGENR
ncbi:MAG: hypothetical protein OXF42_00920 [Candidatus Dadabacteria bacterium]|nr:hypothetical protein [Candidatus Dadabacteria bacterium]